MQLTWYGHATWSVSVGDTALLIDPFFGHGLSETTAEDVPPPEYVLLTHGHADHMADAGAFADATVVGVPELVDYCLAEVGFADGVDFNLGGTVELGDAFVTMHRADHTNGINSGYEMSAGPPAGYIISDAVPTQVADSESLTFYHAGDTGLMTEMRDVIGPFLEPDAAALPIGDHYTMGPMQAAIAVDWLDLDVAFPMHYNTFPAIEVDPERFVREVDATGSDAEVVVLEPGEAVALEELL